MKTNEEYNAHLRSAKPCEILPEPKDDRISLETWESIIKNSHKMQKRSPEEKWELLYRTIFPEDTIIPPPCELITPCLSLVLVY